MYSPAISGVEKDSDASHSGRRASSPTNPSQVRQYSRSSCSSEGSMIASLLFVSVPHVGQVASSVIGFDVCGRSLRSRPRSDPPVAFAWRRSASPFGLLSGSNGEPNRRA